MNAGRLIFRELVERIYNLPLKYKEELKNLLEHNIADERRSEIARNYRVAQKEEKGGKLEFNSSIADLKKML